MRKLILLLSFCTVSELAFCQDREIVTLTLDDCINAAINNNLDIKRAKNNELIAKSNNLLSLMQFLPSVNADFNWDISIGNQFDNNTAQVVNVTTQRSNPTISASWDVFQGLSTYNTRRQRTSELLAAQKTKDNTELTTEANIVSFYLNVIVSSENVKISQQRVDLLSAQLEREVKRESVGVGDLGSIYNLRSQLANEEINLANLQNLYQRNKLQLLQAMLFDPVEAQYEVQTVPVNDEELLADLDPFVSVLDQALQANPGMAAAEASRQAALFRYRATQGFRLPTVSVIGVYGSNYSSNGAFNPQTDEFEENATFLEQMDFNEFQFLRFQFSLPIFTQWRNQNAIQTAKLQMSNAELDNQQARVDATNIVQTVYLDLINAQNTYRAATENLESLEQTFDFMKKRFDTGNADFYAYLESLNNKNRAEVQLSNAKYGIVLRKRILDLYRGLQATPPTE